MSGPITHQVRVEPIGVELTAQHDQTLMEAARAAGFYWPTVCGGKGTCHTCFTVVGDGWDHLSPVVAREAEGIAALALPAERGRSVRLACQARVRGPVTVRKAGVHLID